ncbi:thiol-disulfide oxidoreductase DCC family protein [Kordiimonas aquimaris]|uniref:thiol-disulfide oxidoreductase DCC family protein n=1 Tax=Kordiimonas aquimaris TaxID=707591 RepID=UPI0021D33B77|nr:DUF393 domain-containing protein [Kordiimonas aquimaris]
MITVYYDSRCGLCSREINHYRSIAPKGAFIWKDAIDYADQLLADNISLHDALLSMHARDTDGSLHKGVDAFILIWLQLSHWYWLGRFAGLPIIRQIAGFCYNCFAHWKFNRLPHCQAVRDNNKQ